MEIGRAIMDKRSATNLRVKKKLSDALFTLVDEKGVGSVGISELVARAGVSRMSFYRNFDSIDDVLAYGGSMFFDEYNASSPYESVDFTDVECMTWNLEFWKAHASQIIALNHSGLSHVNFRQVIEIGLKAQEDEEFDPEVLLERRFALGAFYAIALDWIESGAQTDAKELARWYCDMLARGIGGKR